MRKPPIGLRLAGAWCSVSVSLGLDSDNDAHQTFYRISKATSFYGFYSLDAAHAEQMSGLSFTVI